MRMQRCLVLGALASIAVTQHARAQSSLVCPETTSPSVFTGTTLQVDCSSTVTTNCVSKSGVVYDATNNVLKLPATAGTFSPPGSSVVDENVLFGATADFD